MVDLACLGRWTVPLLVWMGVKTLDSRQMEHYLEENVVARLFLGIEGQLSARVRDHSNIARAQAALGRAGWQEVNELIVGEATRLGFGPVEMVSSDPTVQEPAIGYPNEAGIRRGVAQRVYRRLVKVKEKGLEAVEVGKEKAKELFKTGKEYHLLARTPEQKDHLLHQLVAQTQEWIGHSQEVQAGGPQRRENDPIGGQENGADGRGECHLAAADHAMASDRSSGEGQGRARRDYHGAGHCQKQGGQTRGVWVEVADQSHRRGVCFGEGSRSGCGRASNADRSDERVSASFRGESSPEDERLRSWRERTENDRGVETAGRREGRHPTARESQMVRCRGRPARSAQPAREDRGSDRHAQESEVRFQSPNREKPRNVRGCWAAGDGLSEFEQADEGRRRERKESESSNSLKQEEARRRESTEEERREKRGKEEKEAAKGQK